MIIRPETPDDAAAIRSVERDAFGQDVEADLVEALRDAPLDTLSFVAELDGTVVGHVMLTPSLLDAPPRLVTVLALGPLAVAPEHQKAGVGRTLVAHALREAEVAGYAYMLSINVALGFQPTGVIGMWQKRLSG